MAANEKVESGVKLYLMDAVEEDILAIFEFEENEDAECVKDFEYVFGKEGNYIFMNEGSIAIYNVIFADAESIDAGEYGEEKTEEDFKSGEIAWLLNQSEGEHSGIWAQGTAYPVLANEDNQAIYKVSYPEETFEYGNIEGPVYVATGNRVDLTENVEEGYMIDDLEVSGAELINYSYFNMPANDVTISYKVIPILTDITAFPAEQVTPSSFVARWNEVPGATNYYITVKRGSEIVEGYNQMETGLVNSIKVEGLEIETTYSYYLQSLIGKEISDPSNEIKVTTNSNEIAITSLEKYSFVAEWSWFPEVEKYVLSLTKDGEIVNEYENVVTTQLSYLFENLMPQTEYEEAFTIMYEDGTSDNWGIKKVKTPGDYGHQLNNSGFEYWETVGSGQEPVDWNSFETSDVSNLGALGGFAKGVRIKVSEDIRPGSSGQYSSVIWSESTPLPGVIANGNMTCGQIIAMSTNVSTGENHNKTIRSNPDFYEYIGGAAPDSISVWVKFVPKDMEDKARISATIHDNYDYRDPSDEAAEPHAVDKTFINFFATPDKGWQRISIPFDKNVGEATEREYMLVTFTTNENAGKGSNGDSLYIDDMLLIYTPELYVSPDSKKVFSVGNQIAIDYVLEGTMSPTNLAGDLNTVTLEAVADENGYFDTPLSLVTVTTDYSGTLVADIPSSFGLGYYKARLVTTNYPMISEEFEFQIGPEAPVALEAENVGDVSFLAMWEKHAKTTKYLLTVKLRGEVVEGYNDLLVEGATSYLVQGLEPDRSYTYTVKVKVDGYVSEDSNEISVRTSGHNPTPEAVAALEAENVGSHSFTARWEESDFIDFTEYLLTVKENGEVLPGYDGISTELETSYEIIGLNPETTYSYFVVVRSGDYYSLESNEIEVTTTVYVPTAVTALEAEDVDPYSFTAKWGEAEDVTEYLLTVKQGEEVIHDAISTELNTSYSVTGLQPNTEYTYFVVVKVGESYYSEASNQVSVTTARFIPAPVVALDPLIVTETTFFARWEISEDATAYELSVSQNGTVINTYNTGLATMQLVGELEPDTEYKYVVRVIAGDEISEPSNEITVKTFTTGINSEKADFFTVYPSPAKDYLYVEGSKDNSTYYITTVTGSVVKVGTLITKEINVEDLAQGIYFIQIDGVKNKFIKE